jgi:LysM domain
MNPKRKETVSFLPCALVLCISLLALVALKAVVADETLSETKAYYIVREGDTLWGITGHFYQDPYLWPVLWGHNPHIANPHWIYPGDPIYLASLTGTYISETPTEPELVKPVPSAAQLPGVSTLYVSRLVADTALLTAGDVRGTGRVLAARDDKFLLGQGDEIFLQFSGPADPAYQAPYQVLRGLREIKHPQTGKKMGTLYGILGYTSVVGGSQDSVARARIIASQYAIEAGDLVRKGAPPPKEVLSNLSKRELDGWVVAGLRTDDLLATFDICFIDKGIEEGVEVGDTFWVLEPVREVNNPEGAGKVTLPDTRLALLVVIHAEKETSTTLVTNSQGVFSAGYRVRARTK